MLSLVILINIKEKAQKTIRMIDIIECGTVIGQLLETIPPLEKVFVSHSNPSKSSIT